VGQSIGHKERVQAQFGASGDAYVVSPGHAAGDDLEQLVAWVEGGPEKAALDVATGGGHTALAIAPYYGRVVASDLTERMLQSAEAFIRGKGATNVEFRRADAERLPFADGEFDLVTCRIAPHHFGNVAAFVAEVARVLKPEGIFLLEDTIVPDDPVLGDFMNRADKLRDDTHVRSLPAREWREMLAAAGLAVEDERAFRKTHPFQAWLARARTPEPARAEVAALLRDAPPAARQAFTIELDPDGQIASYTDT